MKAKKQIIAVGGGGFTHNEDRDLDQFFLDQISKEKCSIGFLPTASNDDSKKTELFYQRFKNTNFRVSHFNLVSRVKGFENWISNLDAIYIGGGNTKFMLDLWKRNNLINIFKEVYNSGIIVSGVSAGAACWFDYFLTDSDGPGFKPLSGVGLIGLRHEAPKIIKAGDSVWIPPEEEHWHGATKDSSMEHVAIHEALKGKVADWLEHVSERDYLRNPVD